MKDKTKLGIAGLALITALSSCASIQPHGHIDLAYVPSRIDDRYVENQFKAELDSNLEFILSKNISLIAGGTSRTYMTKCEEGFWFEPTRQEFDAYGKLLLKDELEIYGFHNCSHPVNDSPEEQNILWNGETYRLNHDSITELGVKYKW